MSSIRREDIVGEVIENVFCEFEANGIIELVSGRCFVMPSVDMTEVCSASLPTNCSARFDGRLKGATILDVLRPKDLSDIYIEIQSTASVLLDNGLIFSLGWTAFGPRIYIADTNQTRDWIASLQSFWLPFELPSIEEFPELRKLTCGDFESKATQNS